MKIINKLDEEPKMNKGLSSFAKIKGSKKKKRKIKKVKNFKPKKHSSK